MVKKIRLIRTMIKEYLPCPEYYSPGTSIEEMAEIDASVEDTDLTFDDESVTEKVTWEIIEE